jgi:hypothetical protein
MKRLMNRYIWLVGIVIFTLAACRQVTGTAESGPETIPPTPGLTERLIIDCWQKEHPGFSGDNLLKLEEISMENQLTEQMGVKLFRVVEGPLENETFLILGDTQAIRLGEAEGGQGVSSLALSDLDGDGQSELYFTYGFGSGIHQSHLAVYAPVYDAQGTFQAAVYFLGDLSLFSEEPGQVGVRAVEGNPETLTIKCLDTLGTLSLEQIDGQVQLMFNQAEGLPGDVQEMIVYP